MDPDNQLAVRPSSRRSTTNRLGNQENLTAAAPGNVIRSAVPNVKDIIKTYEKLEVIKDLPDAFEAVVDSLQVVERTLSKVPDRLDTSDQASWPDITAISGRWKDKIKAVHAVFNSVASYSEGTKDGDTWAVVLEGYRATLTKLGNGHRVEELMKDVLEEFITLSPYDAFGKATERQLSKFKDAIKELSEVKASDADLEGLTHGNTQNIASGGKGWQNNNHGANQQVSFGGTQYNISGTGTYSYVTSDSNAYVQDKKREERNKIMKALHTSPYKQGKVRNPDHVPGTCKWFVQHTHFQQWRTRDTSSILWVSADPGSGKSVLAKHLIDNVLSRDIDGSVICYFFFKDDFEDQRSAKNAFSCILHQLFSQRDDLFSDDVIDRFNNGGGYEKRSLHDLWDILVMALSQIPRGPRRPRGVVCILDGLDECELKGQSELLGILCNFYRDHADQAASHERPFRLKILITSRPYDSIRKILQPLLGNSGQRLIHLAGEGEVETASIAAEIVLFIRARVEQLTALHRLSLVEKKLLLDRILCVPNRTYLWVYLTLNLIESSFHENMDLGSVTSHLPETVDNAYERILAKSTDRTTTKKLLHIVVAAMRPLTLKEMNFALAIRDDSRTYDGIRLISETRFREYIRNLCGLFVTIIDSKIYLLHQTAKEFLVGSNEASPISLCTDANNDESRWKSSLQLRESHRVLLRITIWYLCLATLENVLTPSQNTRWPEISFRYYNVLLGIETGITYSGKNEFIRYCALYWLDHLFASNREADDEYVPSLLRINDATLLRINDATSGGQSAMWFSTYFFHKEHTLPQHFTNLTIASYFGLAHFVEIEFQQSHIDVNAKDTGFGRSALSWASCFGHDEIVKLLLQLSQAAQETTRDNAKIVDINLKDKIGQTPLSLASELGWEKVVKLLLHAGADVDAVDWLGHTALKKSSNMGHIAIVTLLLLFGASDVQRDEQGRTALERAIYMRAIRKVGWYRSD